MKPKNIHDEAADVARHLLSFAAYGRSDRRALRALRNRLPGHTTSEYELALSRAKAMFQTARALVTKHELALMDLAKERDANWSPYVEELRSVVPDFPKSTYEWVIAWIVYYHHLR